MHEFVYGLFGLLMGYIVAFLQQKGKNDALKKDSTELALLTERGKNLATKEDIQEITRLQEDIKHEFQLKMEQQKTELNKLSKEFELYAIKKHEYYPELYKAILQCILKVTTLRGGKDGINFRKFRVEEITRYMEDKSFTETDKEYVLSNWNNTNKHNAIDHIEKIIREIEYREAKDSYIDAHNFFAIHVLYFSDEVSPKIDELFIKIFALWRHYKPDLMLERDGKLEDEILQMRIDLFKQLQKELKNEETKKNS